jgi:hypothetical protein
MLVDRWLAEVNGTMHDRDETLRRVCVFWRRHVSFGEDSLILSREGGDDRTFSACDLC